MFHGSHPSRLPCSVTLILVLLGAVASAQTTVPGWRPAPSLPMPLAGHGMLLLPGGELLVAGGVTGDGSATRASYLYSAATGTFRPTINQLIAPRAYHALVAVTTAGNTRVFAIGGFNGTAGKYGSEGTVETLEYDASLGNWRWHTIGSLSLPRGDARAAWDGGNFIIVTGGYAQSGGGLRSGTRTVACDRIDLTTLRVESISPMSAARAEHVTARIIGDNGATQLLVAGGEENTTATSTQLLRGTAWDPIANPPLAYHTAGVGIGDPAGIARVFGGFDLGGAPLATCEWYDVKRGWRAAPRMSTERARFDAPLVAGLKDTATAYLAVGGRGAAGALAETELFNLPDASFPNGAWTPFAGLIVPGSERRVAVTGSNLPLVAGGRSGGDVPIDWTEIFQPLRASDLSFGDEEVGRRSDSMPVTIENTWLLPVRAERFRIAGSAEFSFRGDTANFTLAAGARRTIRVYFQPATPGPRDGLLLFDVGSITDTVRLSGRGIASQIGIINSPFDFGTQLITTRRSECGYVLRNSGTDTTVIDSIIVEPPGTFRLISPIGRTRVAPGDSLRICVEFAPGSQGIIDAVATIHLGTRTFPLQVTGRGIRRYLRSSVISAECDTVLYAPGVETSAFILLENRGDTAVHIDAPTLKASATGLFRLAQPAQFPLDLLPGGSMQVEVIFSPQRESREVVAVDFPNNGDTAARVSLCFIARSRYLSVSQPAVDLGAICLGDTATASITVENPGGFDSVEVRSLALTPDTLLTAAGFTARTLAPREYLSLGLRFVPLSAGPLAGTLTIASSRGDVVIPITATVLTPARFTPRSGSVTIGDTALLPVDLAGLGASAVTAARLTLEYDTKLLRPVRVVSLAGGPAVDEGLSGLTIAGGGKASLDIRWSGGVAKGPAFGILCDLLRGDGTIARLALGGETEGGLCVARAEGSLTLLPPCVGSSGLISTEGAEFVMIAPSPASESIGITLVTSEEMVRVEIIDERGRVVDQRLLDAAGRVRVLSVPVGHLPAGGYIVRARTGERVIDAQRVLIAR